MNDLAEKLGNLTYQQIDQLEANLSNPEVQNLHYYNEYIIWLLCQTLRNNRYIADNVQKSASESRMAFGLVSDLMEKIEKLENNINFLLGNKNYRETQNKGKGVPIGRANQ